MERILTAAFAFVFFVLVAPVDPAFSQGAVATTVGEGWANNSVNTVVFRKNSLVTWQQTQFIAYYNKDGFVVVGKRPVTGTKWQLVTTSFKGKTSDAHNTISIMADGAGYLHIAWDHHNDPLHYARSTSPGALEFSKMAMTGINEQKLSYPEFHRLPNGDLLFLYRDGSSGQGNLVLNRYSIATKSWQQVQHNLVDGEKERNAYWQACVDSRGTIHLSWVWRETPDVSSNHDMCYARSSDGGLSWQKSDGSIYQLPVTQGTAEYVARIPQKSELINQTSMYADAQGHPFIATYYKDSGDAIPQYHVLAKLNDQWKSYNLGFRKTAFTLGGQGTKRIPISRPQIIGWRSKTDHIAVIFRDEERGGKVSLATCVNLAQNKWSLTDLSPESVGSWEPTYDTELWKARQRLDLFVQYTDQKDGEGKADIPAQMVKVLQWKPAR